MKQNIQIIDNDGQIIDCFQNATSSINNYDFINRRINKLREFFKQDVIKYLNLDNNFIYELYFYESNDNNAFAAKHSDGYVIAFTTALFDNLYKRFMYIFNKPDVRKLFNITDNDEARLFVLACFDYSTYFIVLHELGHIINGHCSSNFFLKLFNLNKFLNELNSNTNKNLVNFYQQVKESFADISAIAILSGYVYKHADYAYVNFADFYEESKEVVKLNFQKFEFHMAIFAIYNLFLLLDENLPSHTNYLDISHPEPSIRIKYIIPFFMNCMSRYYTDWSIDEIKKLSKSIFQACLKIDTALNSNQIFIKEINTANTKRGDDYCLNLINKIPATQFIYKNMAIVKTRTLPQVDENFLDLFKELQL